MMAPKSSLKDLPMKQHSIALMFLFSWMGGRGAGGANLYLAVAGSLYGMVAPHKKRESRV